MAKHITKYVATNTPTTADPANKKTWYQTIIDLKRIGTSDKSIARRLGCTPAQLQSLYDYVQPGTTFRPVGEAAELAEAEYEITRREIIDEIVTDTEMNPAIRLKGAREDLRDSMPVAAAQTGPVFLGYDIRLLEKKTDTEEDEDSTDR